MTATQVAIAALSPLALAGCDLEAGRLRDLTSPSAPGSAEAAAKDAVQRFVSAVRLGDRNAVLSTVGTPYFGNTDIVSDRAMLERQYEQHFSRLNEPGVVPRTITGVIRYRSTRSHMKQEITQRLDRVLDAGDYIVIGSDGPEELRYFLVDVTRREAKVVGLTAP